MWRSEGWGRGTILSVKIVGATKRFWVAVSGTTKVIVTGRMREIGCATGGVRSYASKVREAIRIRYSKFILYTFYSSRFSLLFLILPHSFILYIILYQLWDPLVTLSKYIHVTSSFKAFIETNLMVQSKFNLIFWFMSYNIFCTKKKSWHALSRTPFSTVVSAVLPSGPVVDELFHGKYRG
jgi:hypothetical protein